MVFSNIIYILDVRTVGAAYCDHFGPALKW